MKTSGDYGERKPQATLTAWQEQEVQHRLHAACPPQPARMRPSCQQSPALHTPLPPLHARLQLLAPSPAPNASLHPSKSLTFCARLAVSLPPPPPVAPGLGWRLCLGVAPRASVAGSATGICPSRNVNATVGEGGCSVKSVSSWPGQIPFLLLQPSLHTAEAVTWEGPIHEQGEGRIEQKSPKWGPFPLPPVHTPVPMSGHSCRSRRAPVTLPWESSEPMPGLCGHWDSTMVALADLGKWQGCCYSVSPE